MSRLPVIVGFGGINPAGRSSSHHGYRRLVIENLGTGDANQTWQSLAVLMGLGADGGRVSDARRQYIRDHTLIRPIESSLFDSQAVPVNSLIRMMPGDASIRFILEQKQLPSRIPDNWQVEETEGGSAPSRKMLVTVAGELPLLIPDWRQSAVSSAGQLPSGLDLAAQYQSRSHPRGLQMTVFGASDAINSMGIDWESIRQQVPGDEIAVYASSAMGQLDQNGSFGMLAAPFQGRRTSSKNCPLGLAEMTADFINAYILGNVGTTGANLGACASFLYNLRQGMNDIRDGRCRVVVAGSSEAPLTPEVIEGYRTMGALAEDEQLRKIDGLDDGCLPNLFRACRPFAENCGFTLAEAAQFVILMDDETALKTGAQVFGSVADVFVNADGYKKSIPGPGIGNYLTLGKAAGSARSILGEKALRERTYVHAHGTGTPQNRVTESHIINELARQFGIDKWPVAAIKSYVGHSLAPASGDQLIAALGTWAYGLIPGIKTIDRVAEDVHHSHLNILFEDLETGTRGMDAALLNSKGFGGNNATACILAPHITWQMLKSRHGSQAVIEAQKRSEKTLLASEDYEARMLRDEVRPTYRFGEGVVESEALELNAREVRIPGHRHPISLDLKNPYPDMSFD